VLRMPSRRQRTLDEAKGSRRGTARHGVFIGELTGGLDSKFDADPNAVCEGRKRQEGIVKQQNRRRAEPVKGLQRSVCWTKEWESKDT